MWAQRLSSVKEPLAGWQPWPKSLVTVKLGYIFTGWNAFGTLSWCTLGSTSSASGVRLAFQEEKQSHYGLIRGKTQISAGVALARLLWRPSSGSSGSSVTSPGSADEVTRVWRWACPACTYIQALEWRRWSGVGEPSRGGPTCMSYTSYVRCCLTCVAAAFPAACLRGRRSAPID